MLTEFTVEAMVPAPTTGNLTDHVLENAHSNPSKVVFSVPRGDAWVGITTAEFLEQVQGVAKGMIAQGVQAGERVGVMSRTRFEWTLVDYGIWYAGCIGVPIYETSSAEQVQWILNDSGAVALFCERQANKAVFDEVAADAPAVTRVWVFDDKCIDALITEGANVSDEELESRRASLNPDSIATIIYTSGTTGRPKGCMLTHKNFMFEVDNVVEGLMDVFRAENSSTLLFLPIAHVFGRTIQLGCVRAQVRMGYAPDVKELLPLLGSFQPTFVLSVPRVFEKIFNSSQQKAIAGGKGNIFDSASKVAIQYSEALDDGGAGLGLKLKHALFDRLVYGKIRAAMGGKIEWAVSGGAPLGSRLGHFFRGIGVTILEGYGLTETSAASTVNRPNAIGIGSVGQPFPGSSVRIAADGEVMLKGDHIFAGYWNNPTATAEAIESDGWFHSGDIGEIDDRGFVRITGRKKEIIVTAAGKNVAPAVLEDRLRAHFLVGQCMVVGDAQPFIGALITLDPEALPVWLAQQGLSESTPLSELVNNEIIQSEIQGAVDSANKAVSAAESIKKFTILEADWTEEGGQMTPSLKLKRNVVFKEHEADIASIYS
jgi:long-chain acyl-CoA synthetase